MVLWALLLIPSVSLSQVIEPDGTKTYYLIHSSGHVMSENSEERAVIQSYSGSDEQLLYFIPAGSGYYWIKPKSRNTYLANQETWRTYFVSDSTSDNAKWAIEKVSNSFVRIRCKVNSKYLGTDETTSGSYVYSDKNGTNDKHYWYISENYNSVPTDTLTYLINPNATFNHAFEGWGVSLCWWANMCGRWSDEKIDEIVDWLVSPEGLNYKIFRYNIGGGDDPLNRNCTPHHMASGKGIRAEMEGFKDSLNADYDWSRDAAQRKIMLKIKEKRPDAIFEAFSNSAPYYMTYSGCCAGNINAWEDNLKPEFYDEFAHYLVDVCKFYKDSFGIVFKTLEPFNEPVTNYWSANGGQEGCHFSTPAQINFLKVLSPVLKASGLNTIISASDESIAEQSVTDFLAYIEDGTALDLVGQWNTHTYGATHKARANLRALSTANNKALWMSEVGSGGSGISGNLSLAQKLMDDIRYIRPEAWIDWQYVEENNDQWCMVRGNFASQTYTRVKNYFVRQQFSRYIKAGSKFLSVPNDQMLAALNPPNDSLTIVLLNNSSTEVCHRIDLTMFDQFGSSIDVTRTSETENNAISTEYELNDSALFITLPGYSVTTVVAPVTFETTENQIKTGISYLILSRTASLPMQSTANSVSINNYLYGDSTQLWTLTESGNGYTIKNLAGKYLTDAGTYKVQTSSIENLSNQTFQIEHIGDDCYRIQSNRTGKSLDLEGENNTAGTQVGLWPYGNTPAASHRQWMFVLPPTLKKADIPSGINNEVKINEMESVRIFGTQNSIVILQTPGISAQVKVYSIAGAELLHQEIQGYNTRIPIHSGIYIVRYTVHSSHKAEVNKVIVR